ncbi:aminotransferase class I/II-fold pyridoxal phosphate-dependent enzyme, partial [Enterococcus faecium]
VAFSNGTAALHAACYAAGITQGDEVITTPITFAASANCVRYMGGEVIFADIDEETYNLDPKEVEKKITSKTKAIIPVDF